MSVCDSTGRLWGATSRAAHGCHFPRFSSGSSSSWATHACLQDTWAGAAVSPLSGVRYRSGRETCTALEPQVMAQGGQAHPCSGGGAQCPGGLSVLGGSASWGARCPASFHWRTCHFCSGLTCVPPPPNSSSVEDLTPTASEWGLFGSRAVADVISEDGIIRVGPYPG